MGSIFHDLIDVPEPKQARSREALDRFLAAGERLLAENRYEEAGVAEIAREANSSVGTFYRLLTDKETLSLLLMQRFFTEVELVARDTLGSDQWQGQSVNDVAEGFVDVFATLYQGRRGALRAMILRASKDAQFRDQVHQLNTLISKQMANALRQHKSVMSHPKPEQAIKIIAHMIIGILNQYTITGSLGSLSPKHLKSELVRLINQYLGV